MTTRTTLRRPALRRFVGHYLEIVVAAVAGMLLVIAAVMLRRRDEYT
jgi:hypothetical protein